jgi:homoserine kinase type II
VASHDPNQVSSVQAGELPDVVAAFGLGGIFGCQFLEAGTMHLNWYVNAEHGPAALKRVSDRAPVADPAQVAAIAKLLAPVGVPVPEPLRTGSGQYTVHAGTGRWHATHWTEGRHIAEDGLTVAHATALGETLGAIHRRLRDGAAAGVFDAGSCPYVDGPIVDAETADREAARLLAVIAALEHPTEFDQAAAVELEQRREMLASLAGAQPGPAAKPGPVGWTHGDFQPYNLLFDRGHLAAVLDWDRLRVQPLARELVRSAIYLFPMADGSLDLERIAAFARAWRAAVHGVTRAATDAAAERMWWTRLTDLWILQFRYDRGDDAVTHWFARSCATLRWWTDHRPQIAEAFAAGS